MKSLFLISFICLASIIFGQGKVDKVLITYQSHNQSLAQILADLESTYNIRFSYATESINTTDLDVDFNTESLSSVLDVLLGNQNLDYKIINGNVLIRKSGNYEVIENEIYNESLHLQGRLIDNNGNPLVYASIAITNSAIGSYTSNNGSFDIEIPERYQNENLVISYLGYDDIVYVINEMKEEYILVSMDQAEFFFEEVIIVNREKPIRFGNADDAILVNKAQINNITSGIYGGDIGRQIQLLPGVAAHEDDSAMIKIRGGNEDETLMILDGIPLYNPSHYYGIFSSVNPEYADSVRVYKNTYPMEYGGKTAGLVEINSGNLIPPSANLVIDLDLLKIGAVAKVPLSKSIALKVGARSTLKSINNNQFNTTKSNSIENLNFQSFQNKIEDSKSEPSFMFYDINTSLFWSGKSNDKISLNFYHSNDVLINRFNTDLIDQDQKELKVTINENHIWTSFGGSLILDKYLGDKFSLHTKLAVSQYDENDINDIKLVKIYKPGSPQPPDSNPLFAALSFDKRNQVKDLSIDNHSIISLGTNQVKVGVIISHHEIDYVSTENANLIIRGRSNFEQLGGYGNFKGVIAKKINYSLGARLIYFDHIRHTTFSPRISLQYRANSKFSLKSSFGIYEQIIRQLYYEYNGVPQQLWVNAGHNGIPILRSVNIMAGATLKLGYFNFDVECFQKDMKGMLIFSPLNPGVAKNNPDDVRDYILFKGDGFSRGVDFIISSGYKNYDTYLSYTLSKTEHRFKRIFNNNYFPSENDRRHQFKWYNSYSHKKWNVGLNSIYVSGRPYTDISKAKSKNDIRNTDPDSRLERLSPYFRLDISASYDMKIGRSNIQLSASVFNLLNTNNVKYIQSVSTDLQENQLPFTTVIGSESSLLNRTFNLGLKIKL